MNYDPKKLTKDIEILEAHYPKVLSIRDRIIARALTVSKHGSEIHVMFGPEPPRYVIGDPTKSSLELPEAVSREITTKGLLINSKSLRGDVGPIVDGNKKSWWPVSIGEDGHRWLNQYMEAEA